MSDLVGNPEDRFSWKQALSMSLYNGVFSEEIQHLGMISTIFNFNFHNQE